MKTEQELRAAHFTESGVQRFLVTERAYADELFKKAGLLGEADKGTDTPLEITHDHVRRAALALGMRRERTSGWFIACQVAEYVCAAGAGVGSNYLNTQSGIILFGGSLVVGVILFIVRMTWDRNP